MVSTNAVEGENGATYGEKVLDKKGAERGGERSRIPGRRKLEDQRNN